MSDVNPARDRSAGAQAAACRQAAAYYSGRQSGPKPRGPEAVFLASLLVNAERTLTLVEKYRDQFAIIVQVGDQ